MNSRPSIIKGSIFIYRVFDVAEEIDLLAVERLLSEDKSQERLRWHRNPKRSLVMRNAPVVLAREPVSFQLGSNMVSAETNAKVWDYGVFSLSFHLTIPPGTTWEELVRLAFELEHTGSIDPLAHQRCQELAAALAPAMKDSHEWDVFEDYVVYFLEQLDGIPNPGELLKTELIPNLILAEPDLRISQRAQEAILESSVQYTENDLAVIDWNSAVVVEPTGNREVTDILEFALTHLMEVRYYDDLLDRRLATLYDAIELQRSRLFKNSFTKTSHDASARYIEFSEFTERVDNSLKVVGDSYLATVFRLVVRRFRMSDWEESITRKMNILARVSQLLQGEVNTRRSLWLEATILLLIAFELITTFLIPLKH